MCDVFFYPPAVFGFSSQVAMVFCLSEEESALIVTELLQKMKCIKLVKIQSHQMKTADNFSPLPFL